MPSTEERELYSLLIKKYPIECNSFNALSPSLLTEDYVHKLALFILLHKMYPTECSKVIIQRTLKAPSNFITNFAIAVLQLKGED
jgi:hypothetical protein